MNDELLGQGSFGKVYWKNKSSNIQDENNSVKKIITIFDFDNTIQLQENNIIEIFSYYYLNTIYHQNLSNFIDIKIKREGWIATSIGLCRSWQVTTSSIN